MTDLTYWQALLLGAVQGLTEFLPISSSAHLALSQRLMALEADSAAMLLFDAFVHIGTVLSIGIVFFHPELEFLRRLRRELEPSWNRARYGWRIIGFTAAASVPTGVIGLLFKKKFEGAFDNPRSMGLHLCVTGGLLFALMFVPRGRRGWKQIHWWEAGLVGVVQGLAIFPGISRSGSTICTASYCGWRRKWAAHFSFLIAMPAILGGTVIKLKDTLELPAAELQAIPWGAIVVGALVSTVVGVLALKLLLSAVRRAKLHYFAPYCVAVGLWAMLFRT